MLCATTEKKVSLVFYQKKSSNILILYDQKARANNLRASFVMWCARNYLRISAIENNVKKVKTYNIQDHLIPYR